MKIWPVSTLTNPQAGTVPYLLTAWACATIPAFVILGVVSAVLPPEMMKEMNEEIIGSTTDLLAMVFGFVVFAPLAETLVMTAVFAIFAIMRIPLTLRIPLTAGIAGALHALIALPWAATTTWLFFIFSVVYITQQRRSESRAFAMTTGVHALNNAVPAAAMLMAGTLS